MITAYEVSKNPGAVHPEPFVTAMGSTAILDGSREGLLASVGGSLLTEQIVSLDGHPCRELSVVSRSTVFMDT